MIDGYSFHDEPMPHWAKASRVLRLKEELSVVLARIKLAKQFSPFDDYTKDAFISQLYNEADNIIERRAVKF